MRILLPLMLSLMSFAALASYSDPPDAPAPVAGTHYPVGKCWGIYSAVDGFNVDSFTYHRYSSPVAATLDEFQARIDAGIIAEEDYNGAYLYYWVSASDAYVTGDITHPSYFLIAFQYSTGQWDYSYSTPASITYVDGESDYAACVPDYDEPAEDCEGIEGVIPGVQCVRIVNTPEAVIDNPDVYDTSGVEYDITASADELQPSLEARGDAVADLADVVADIEAEGEDGAQDAVQDALGEFVPPDLDSDGIPSITESLEGFKARLGAVLDQWRILLPMGAGGCSLEPVAVFQREIRLDFACDLLEDVAVLVAPIALVVYSIIGLGVLLNG